MRNETAPPSGSRPIRGTHCRQWVSSRSVDLLPIIKMLQTIFISNSKKNFSEEKRLGSLRLTGIYQAEPSNGPPSCTTPRQLTIYVLNNFYFFIFPSHQNDRSILAIIIGTKSMQNNISIPILLLGVQLIYIISYASVFA